MHRLRGQGSHGHAGHADTVPAVDVILGVYHPENASVSDFHSLLPVSRKAAQIIASFLAGDKSVTQNHDHSTPKAASGHSSTSQSSDRLHKNSPIISSPNKYLSGSACEQLKHGLNPQEVIIHPLNFSQFRDIAQDPRPEDSWMLFLYGPWPDSTGKPCYSFAISKLILVT